MRKPGSGFVAAALVAFGLSVGIASSASAATLNNDNGGDGFVIPGFGGFVLVGSDDGCGCEGSGPNTTTYLDVAATNLNITYNWGYATFDEDPSFDPAGYVVGGIFTQLTDDYGPVVQSGVITLAVSAGQNYGFYVYSTDQCCGPGLLAVETAPVPAALPLFAGGLGMLTWAARRKRRPTAVAVA